MTSKVRIVSSDGIGYNTLVTDAETGAMIPHIIGVDVRITVNKVVEATLHTIMPIVDVVADAEEKRVCPVCHRVANPEIVNPEHVAQMFHEAYERLAPEYRYQTCKESAVPWADVLEGNKRLMIAIVADVLYKLNIK